MQETGSATTQIGAIITRETERIKTVPYGYDWCELSREEEAVFGISLDTMPALISYWEAYLAVLGITIGALDREISSDLIERFFDEQPQLQDKRGAGDTLPVLDEEGFIRFAALFGCPHRHASAWYWKQTFWERRQGLMSFEDEV